MKYHSPESICDKCKKQLHKHELNKYEVNNTYAQNPDHTRIYNYCDSCYKEAIRPSKESYNHKKKDLDVIQFVVCTPVYSLLPCVVLGLIGLLFGAAQLFIFIGIVIGAVLAWQRATEKW